MTSVKSVFHDVELLSWLLDELFKRSRSGSRILLCSVDSLASPKVRISHECGEQEDQYCLLVYRNMETVRRYTGME